MSELSEKLASLLTSVPSDCQEKIEHVCGMKMPPVYFYEGFSRGNRATEDRCAICGKLLGHRCFVVVDGDKLAHSWCYARRKAGATNGS